MLDTSEITVLIKAPNQRHADHPVKCECSWTVQQLKSYLAEHYPTKPTVWEQRLIYLGQLLTDTSRLGEVFRQHEDHSTVHTVHLVCLPPAEPAPAAAHAGLRQRRAAQQQSTQAPPAAAPAPEPTPPPPPAAGQVAPPAVEAPLPQQYDLAQWVNMVQNNQHHLVAMQQMYSQYWTQYAQMVQLNSGALPMFWPQPVPVPSQPAAPAPAAPAPAPAQGQPAPPQPAPNNNVLNAQGGIMEEEEAVGGQWDWLDWLHGLSRLSVLFLAVYFYASVSRLVVVLFFGFMAYLYNQGWFHEGRARPAAVAPAPQQQQQQPQQEEAAQQQEQDQGAGEEREAASDVQIMEQTINEMGVTPPPPARPDPLNLVWTFFSSFFTSLIPERIE